MKKFIGLSIVLLLSCNPPQTNYHVVEDIPNNCIELHEGGSGTFEVNTIINEELAIPFLLDTGASDTCVSPQVYLTLIQTGTINGGDILPPQTYVLADGSTVVNRRFIIRELQIGKFVLTDLEASVGNNIKSPMLLGQSALMKLGVITIDYENNRICVKNYKRKK